MKTTCLLIGDIGGTNARFALAAADGPEFSRQLTLHCDDYETAGQCIAEYLERNGSPAPKIICLAVAGPVVNGCVRFLNSPWEIDSRQLQQQYPSSSVILINDFEAVARSIPLLGKDDITTIGALPSELGKKSDYTIGVLGPGTGLGVSGLLRRGKSVYPVVGEGSHAGFAPENRIQFKVLEQIRQRFERVSYERLVSGPGLENVYWALCKIHGKADPQINAATIFSRGLANEDVIATEAIGLFFESLGQVAGNLALTLGAYDGIYLAGGIVKRYPDLLKSSRFRWGFENKGRHRSLMEQVPTSLILHPQPGLLGAGYSARMQLQQLTA